MCVCVCQSAGKSALDRTGQDAACAVLYAVGMRLDRMVSGHGRLLDIAHSM